MPPSRLLSLESNWAMSCHILAGGIHLLPHIISNLPNLSLSILPCLDYTFYTIISLSVLGLGFFKMGHNIFIHQMLLALIISRLTDWNLCNNKHMWCFHKPKKFLYMCFFKKAMLSIWNYRTCPVSPCLDCLDKWDSFYQPPFWNKSILNLHHLCTGILRCWLKLYSYNVKVMYIQN